MSRPWDEIADAVRAKLDREDDDIRLWEAVVDEVYADATFLSRGAGSRIVVSTIGRCSKWLRPHQTRWTAAGGFAWPTGYGGRAYSRTGLPDHDWAIELLWDDRGSTWHLAGHPQSTADLEFRVSIPARSVRHRQAAIHTIWRPGSPVKPRDELVQFYGFRTKDGTRWDCVAASDREAEYELAAPKADDA